MLNLGAIEVGKKIYIPFATYGTDRESITATGLATSDIKIYKDGAIAQRTGVSGVALLDDGMDFDTITGIHAFSIDLSDNDDAGFYAAGSEYWVVVDSIIVNTQTVSFIAAVFNIQNRNSMLDAILQGNNYNTRNSVGWRIRRSSGGVPETTVHSGTAQGGTLNTITFDTGALATDNIYRGNLVNITGGTGVGQTNSIFSYAGSTKVATMSRNWITTPDATSTFDVIAASSAINSDEGVAQAGANNSITLATTASASDDIYNGALVTILSGTGSGETKIISDYDGGTKIATTAGSAWGSNPDTTSVYAVIPDSQVSGNVAAAGPTASEIRQELDANSADFDTLVAGVAANQVDLNTIISNQTGGTMSVKTWAAAVELHKTAAYGGTDAALAADQQYDYTADVDLETAGQNGAQVTIQYRGSTAADDLIVDVFASLDGTTFDTEPVLSKTLPNNGTPRIATLVIPGLAHFRIGVKSSGTGSTFEYEITHQRFI